MHHLWFPALATATALSLAGCPAPTDPVDAHATSTEDAFIASGTDSGPADAPPAVTTVSFAADIAPTISGTCGTTRCHSVSPYAFLMGSTRCATAVNPRLAVPGNADNSYVIAKLEGASTICGSAMPAARRLSAAQITTIRTWINEGALNN